jgi:glycosyltransferase involved in cell wall biosynthesis
VIIVDDASTDDTCAIVEKMAPAAPCPVQLIRQPSNSGGPVRPMNVGVNRATGEYVAILDHDDLYTNETVATWTSVLQGKIAKPGIVTSDFARFTSQKELSWGFIRERSRANELRSLAANTVTIFRPETARRLLCREFCLPHKGAFSKAAWLAVGGFDEAFRSAWDADFIWKLASKFEVAYIAASLVRVRVHDRQLSGNDQIVARELITVYQRMLQSVSDRAERRILQAHINRELFDLAYVEFKGGRYWKAAWHRSRLAVRQMICS